MDTAGGIGRGLACLGLCAVAGIATWKGHNWDIFFMMLAVVGSYWQWH